MIPPRFRCAFVSALALASAALAQPAATDLGTLTANTPATATFTISPGLVQWYTLTLPTDVANPGFWLDMVTNGPVNIDTMICLYDSAGNRVSPQDDDDGPPAGIGFSLLTYGEADINAAGRFPAPAGSTTGFNGRDGGFLAAGTYYLGVTGFAATFGLTDWNITTAHTRNGQVDVWVNYGGLTGPYPPVGSGSATVNPVEVGGSTVIVVAVSPGGNPASTGIEASADLSALGGSAAQTLFDDGTNGDATAGDNSFSYQQVVSAGTGEGAIPIAFSITDDQARIGNGSFLLNVTGVAWDETADGGGDAGDLPASAQLVAGSGALMAIAGAYDASDVDMYLIEVCDPANFVASTFNSSTTVDTQLFLFNLDGTGVTANDDVPNGFPGDATLQSRISGMFVTAAGNYYLAISRYNRDPQNDLGELLWINTPFGTERAPDGPGAATPVAQWAGTTAVAASYRISLTGACYISAGPGCDPDFNCDGNPDQDDVACMINVVAGNPGCECQDPDFNQDGNVDQEDVAALINVVAGGDCP